MAQHDYSIDNQGFPAFRSDLNNVLEAINTNNSGSSRPSSAVAGTVWLDTTNATNPTLKFFDGTDDISLAQFDYSANTVNWLDSTVATDLINDSSPQLGADLDLNSSDITGTGNVNITGTVTATSFSGDGSGLSGVTSVGGATGVDFNDNVKARFGTGNDLEIFHNDSGSFIKDVGTSNLFIDTDGNAIELTSGGTAESMARFVKDGEVSLYHNNVKKFETTTDGVSVTGHVEPSATDTYDLGQSDKVWRNIYTGDLHLSNEAKDQGNSVDGTKGNWTIQEGAEDLFIVNNKSGKKYKFKLEEI